MAWSEIGLKGSGNNKSSSTSTVTCTSSAAVAVGAILVVAVAFDNTRTTDGTSTLASISDSSGNIYTRVLEYQNTVGGAAGDGAAVGVYVGRVTAALLLADTFTAAFTTIPTAKVLAVDEFAVASGKTWALATTAVTPFSASAAPSVAISGLASQEYLFLGVLATEGATGTFTNSAGFNAINSEATTGGSADTNVTLRWARHILTGTGDTYAPTYLTARDGVAALVALKEINLDVLVVADATHAHTADNVALTGLATLVVADATHAHTADNVGLGATGSDEYTDAYSDAYGSAPSDSLAVNDATHGHTADNVSSATSAHTLVVESSGHEHTATNVLLAETGALVSFNNIWRRLAGDPGDGIRVATVGADGTVLDWLTANRREYEYRAEAVAFNGTSTFGAWV